MRNTSWSKDNVILSPGNSFDFSHPGYVVVPDASASYFSPLTYIARGPTSFYDDTGQLRSATSTDLFGRRHDPVWRRHAGRRTDIRVIWRLALSQLSDLLRIFQYATDLSLSDP